MEKKVLMKVLECLEVAKSTLDDNDSILFRLEVDKIQSVQNTLMHLEFYLPTLTPHRAPCYFCGTTQGDIQMEGNKYACLMCGNRRTAIRGPCIYCGEKAQREFDSEDPQVCLTCRGYPEEVTQ